jgi:hypothetical protein
MLSALALIAAPVATATASAAPSTARGGDPLALLAIQQAELTAADAATNDCFGYSVALSGDTALVGAPYRTVSGHADAGVAYVFVRSGTSWSQQAELSDPDPAANDWFGDSVALDGGTALVVADGKTVGGHADAGAAYVFVRSGTSWSQQAELTASNAAANDYFGSSVALSGDTAVIGVAAKTVGGQGQAGAAYVFTRSGVTWSQQAELTASDAAASDYFGYSVALSGDTALVGAPFRTVSGQTNAGVVYVFVRSGTTWSRQAELSDPDTATGDRFGTSVALDGDTALIGAPDKTISGQADAGEVYVYTRSGTSWSQQAELTASSAVAYDYFGDSVALSGDTALVGDPYRPVGGVSHAGVAYVFVRSGTSWSQQAELTASDAAVDDWFSSSVALSGGTALVGAGNKTVSGLSQAGAAYVEVLPSSDDTLSNLTVSAGSLSPSFTAAHLDYTDNVAHSVSTITVTPTVNESHAGYVLKVGSTTVTNPVPLNVGANVIDVQVTAQDGTNQTYSVTVTRALLIPKLTLKLSGPKHGVLKPGKRLTAKGTVTPTSLVGGTVTLTVQRKQGSKWLTLTSLTPTISAKGTYSATYKPAKTGSYRIEATIAKTATSTAAASKWLTFKVK